MRLFVVAYGLLLLTGSVWAAAAEPSTGGVFVAVGEEGRRVTSTDGVTWTNDLRWDKDTIDPGESLFDVTFGAGKFVAVGGGSVKGYILHSRNGRDWQGPPALSGEVTTVVFGRGRFVAMHGGELLSSTDGEQFTAGSRLEWKGDIRALRSACGDTEAGFRYVTVGDIDLRAERRRSHWRAVTEDGVTYQYSALDLPAAVDVAYGSGHFVVVGPAGLIESSHDGQAWEKHSVSATENFSHVFWTGSQFVASGDGARMGFVGSRFESVAGTGMWTSPDGLEWKRQASPFAGAVFFGHGNFLFLALGAAKNGQVYYSPDFATWTAAQIPRGPAFNAVAFGQPESKSESKSEPPLRK